MALVLGTTYDNVFYDDVLTKLRSIITTDRACTVYIAPSYQDHGSFSIRLWGSSAETDELYPDSWRKAYNVEISLYTLGEDGDERFYEQLYSDAERLYQLLFNNSSIATGDNTWKDGRVGEITFDDFVEGEEAIDNLHVARFSFSCRITR
jgi:hypothetical protein